MRITCIAATTISKDMTRFTLEALEQMNSTINNKTIPILLNFDKESQIGEVLSSTIKNNEMHIMAEITEDSLKGYIVPSCRVLSAKECTDDKHFEITEAEIVAMGLIIDPADKGVTKW